MTTVLLTAASSFIGSNLGAYLHEQGYAVHGTVRKDKYGSFKPFWLEKCDILDLTEAAGRIDNSIFCDVDVVIHLAQDLRENMMDANIRATEEIELLAEKSGVKKQIYFSSYSARPDAVSEYGEIKYRLEQYFLKKGHIIVRPGLVIGHGGMSLRLINAVKKFPVIPLPDGGKGAVPIISIRQLCEVINRIITLKTCSQTEFNIFYPEMTSMKALTRAMKIATGSKAIILPIPSDILLWASSIGRMLGIKLPFNVGSAKSFKKNQQKIHDSNIAGMIDKFDTDLDAVKAALSD